MIDQIWKYFSGSPVQAPLSLSGDYVISHRLNNFTVTYRPEGKHIHVGTYSTIENAKIAADKHSKHGADK